MTALNPNNTERFRVNYTVGGKQHTFEVRTNLVSPSSLGTLVTAFLTPLSTIVNQIVIDNVTYAAGGSNIFNLVTTGIEGDSFGSGAGTGSAVPNFINFIGRSAGGRRVRLAVYGLKTDSTDYRFAPGENASIDDAIDALKAPANAFLSIDDVKPVWYDYANAGVNAYWQRNLRP